MKNRRDQQIRKGLHAEHVARNPRYYVQLNDHPNYRKFKPEYQDQFGRLYEKAKVNLVRTEHPVPVNPLDPLVKLNVKLPPGTEWYDRGVHRTVLHLSPLRPDRDQPHVVIPRKHYIMQGHRTGHIHVLRIDWETRQ